MTEDDISVYKREKRSFSLLSCQEGKMGEKRGEEIFGSGYVLCKSTLFLQSEDMGGGKRWITPEGIENKG